MNECEGLEEFDRAAAGQRGIAVRVAAPGDETPVAVGGTDPLAAAADELGEIGERTLDHGIKIAPCRDLRRKDRLERRRGAVGNLSELARGVAHSSPSSKSVSTPSVGSSSEATTFST